MTISSSSRDGRLLVECLVATLLISATALTVASLAQTVAQAEQTAQRTSLAWQLTLQRDALARTQPCDALSTAGSDAQIGVATSWRITPQSSYREFQSDLSLTFSALVNRHPTTLTWRDAWSCE